MPGTYVEIMLVTIWASISLPISRTAWSSESQRRMASFVASSPEVSVLIFGDESDHLGAQMLYDSIVSYSMV